MNTTAPRPTENQAVGNVHDRVLASIDRLYALLAHAIRCHDRNGANLLRHAVQRALAGGRVGAL